MTAAGTVGSVATARVAQRHNRYYEGPVSDHFDGVRFLNAEGTTWRGFMAILRWWIGEAPAEWPEAVPLTRHAMPAERVGDLTVMMVGDAALLIQSRVIAPGIAFDDSRA